MSTDSNVGESIESADNALIALAECVAYLAAEAKVRSSASVTMEELRNRAIYELNGQTMTSEIDEQDDTLPYLAETGTRLDHVVAVADNAVGAINYILNNTDEYETSDSE